MYSSLTPIFDPVRPVNGKFASIKTTATLMPTWTADGDVAVYGSFKSYLTKIMIVAVAPLTLCSTDPAS